jgi:hypothetical protein
MKVRPPQTQSTRGKTSSFATYIIGSVCVVACFQLLINGILFSNILPSSSRHKNPSERRLDDLQDQLHALQVMTSEYVADGMFVPFTIRDARHLVPTQIPQGIHIFDYVDLHSSTQEKAQGSQLFHNARLLDDAPCQRYSVRCYKEKILQVLDHILETNPDAEYFFYMESDNDLCISLSELRRLTYQYHRYFIATGTGFSGWIMSRQFVVDFLKEFRPIHGKHKQQEEPDPIGSFMLIRTNAWTVTRKYFVSHTIVEGQGAPSLTVKSKSDDNKHSPRCLEPRRSKWKTTSNLDLRDRFGWDYFDYEACPDADIFPCQDGQLEALAAKELEAVNLTLIEERAQKHDAQKSTGTAIITAHNNSGSSLASKDDDDENTGGNSTKRDPNADQINIFMQRKMTYTKTHDGAGHTGGITGGIKGRFIKRNTVRRERGYRQK